MPIEEFYARSETDVVTFSKYQVFFSSSLVKAHRLKDFDYVRIGTDSELRRIYFGFQKAQAPGLAKFFASGRSNRKSLAAGKLYATFDWIAEVVRQKNRAKKQFLLEEVGADHAEVYSKYQFFITIGYWWSNERDFQAQEEYPVEPGVYRLKKSGEIVRIGQGVNIRDRLVAHLKEYGAELDTYDFEIVPNEDERKKEEKRLLELFKGAVGRLPRFNPISN